MDKIFKVLNIEETKDSEQIKAAYRKQLAAVHPEEDPEGFKQLRSAYERALAWANEPTEDSAADQTEADVWLSKVEELYASLSRRVSLQEWTRLFEDDLCVGLDTFYAVREKLMVFLMDHYHLPFEIWQLIDQCFNIAADKADLSERFPKSFIYYVLNSISQPPMLDFSLFQGADRADYDQYIENYHELKRHVDEKQELPKKLLADLRNIKIYHPYSNVEVARYHMNNGHFEDAFKALKTLHEKYPQDAYILFYLAQVKWERGDYDGAFLDFEALVGEHPQHFSALLGMGDYYLKKGDFKKAKDIFLDAAEKDPHNYQLREKIQLANNNIIDTYKSLVTQGTAGGDDKIELGWCYLQNEDYSEALTLLMHMDAEEKKHFHYNNLMGRIYLCLELYEEALPHIRGWIEDIKALKEGTDKETRRRKQRLGYAHLAAAICFGAIAEAEKNEAKSEELILRALAYFDLAVELEQDDNERLSHLQHKANFLFVKKRYQESIDVCEKILKEQDYYYTAYLTRQECYFALEYYQNVIEDYYHCIEIFAGHARPYILAAKTFWIHNDFEAGQDVIKTSKENDIVSDELILYESRFLYGLAQSRKEIERALALCTSLVDKNREETDLEAFGDVFYHCACCLADLGRSKKALKAVEKAISLDDNADGEYRLLKANILTSMGHTEEGLEIYEQLNREMPENSAVLFRMGNLYSLTSREVEAENYYKRTLKVHPQHSRANYELMCIYKNRLEAEQRIQHFDKAVAYASSQIDISPEAYYYIERGLIYLENNCFQEALDDFTKASELEPENIYALNSMGMVFRRQERHKEAIHYFQKAVELTADDETPLLYGNMGRCYADLGNMEEALGCFMKNLRLFPKEPSVYEELGNFLSDTGRFSEAINYYIEAIDLKHSNTEYFMLKMGDVYRRQKNWTAAERQYMKVIETYPEYPDGYKSLAELYTYNLSQYKKAAKYLQAVLKRLPKEFSFDYGQFAYELGIAYFFQGKKKKAAKWFHAALELYEETFGIENYIALPSGRMARLYELGQIYFYLNEQGKAKQYFLMMGECSKCHFCSYSGCHERCTSLGMIAEMEGRLSEAEKYYQEALGIDPYNQEAMLRLKYLRKRT